MNKFRANVFVLYSGGLDSMITAHLLKSLNYNVTLITFRSEFFNKGLNEGNDTVTIGDYTFERITKDVTLDYLPLIKKPKFGHGKNLNPCIDCKIFFLKKAKELMGQYNIDFLATGEVIGQRPKSQRSKPLNQILKDADVEEILLRPLTIKHLPVSPLEEKGLADREELSSIIDCSGRVRSPQMEYARKNNITDYSSPAGGCLLTHKEFCQKLKTLIDNNIEDKLQYEMLKTGKHYILPSENGIKKLIVGKNQIENEILEEYSTRTRVVKLITDVAVPVSIILFDDELSENMIELIAFIIAANTKISEDTESIKMMIYGNNTESREYNVPFDLKKAKEYAKIYRI